MVSLSSSVIASAYLVLTLGSLAIFSTVYRRRKAQQSQNVEPWFPNHRERDIYLTLLHLEPPCPPRILKAALLERAREDISRVYILRESKAAAGQLLRKGSISEVTFQQILAAEAELNTEIADVMAEAKALGGEEWGGTILPQANEYYQKKLILQTIERSKVLVEREKKKWEEDEKIRTAIKEKQREIALKELTEEEGILEKKVGEDSKAIEGEIPNGVNTEGLTERKSKKKKNKK